MNVQLDDVRMSQQLQILNLPFYPPSHITADELLPRNDLERNLLVCNPMDGQLHLAKGTLSQGSYDLICADPLLGLLLRRRLGELMGFTILGSASARVGRFVLRATVGRGCEGDLELAVVVCAVRHHSVVCMGYGMGVSDEGGRLLLGVEVGCCEGR